MNKLIYLIFAIILCSSITMATYYVKDKNNCPATYMSQSGAGGTLLCGYNGGIAFWYDMSLLSLPAGTASGTVDYTCLDTTCDGGYILDCASYDGTEPFCDNGGAFLCDRNSTCYAKHTNTRCDGGGSSTTCNACLAGYVYCDASLDDADGCEVQSGVTNCAVGSNNNLDATCTCQCDGGYADCDASGKGVGNGCEVQEGVTACSGGANNNLDSACACQCDAGYLDCDAGGKDVGNGCEVQVGGACNVGGLAGTYVGCTCTVPKSYFETGTFIEYLTNTTQGAMLWFKNWYANGWLINVSNSKNETWGVNNESCVVWKDGSIQCTAPTGSSTTNNITGVGCADSNNYAKFYNETHIICNSTPLTSNYDDSWINGTIVAANSSLHDWIVDQNYLSGDGNVVINGNLTVIGEQVTLNVTNANVNGSFYPELENLFDIGSAIKRWNNVYANNLDGRLDCSNITNAVSNLCTLVDTNPLWVANYTNMQTDCPAGNYSYGLWPNGSFKCRDDVSGGGGTGVPYTGATQDVNLSYRNITANIYYFNRNESLGIWSNTTDTVIGFIGGLP